MNKVKHTRELISLSILAAFCFLSLVLRNEVPPTLTNILLATDTLGSVYFAGVLDK